MFPPTKKPAGMPPSLGDIRKRIGHASADPDGDNDGQPVSCPSCGAALNLTTDKTAPAAAAGGPADMGSPELAGGSSDESGGGGGY